MRKLCLLTVLMVSLFTPISVLADGVETCGVENMPSAIKTIIADSRWSDWEITGWVNPKGLRSANACAFAVVKNGSHNDLLAFGWGKNGWKYKWHNASALPQVDAPVLLGITTKEKEPVFTSFYVLNEEIQECFCVWVQKSDGTWHLNELLHYDPLMFFDTSVEGILCLYNTGWVEGEETDVKVYGTYQTSLRYFDLEAFPKTVQEARNKLSNPPEIPAGALSAKKIRFVAGKKYKVYQGPGEEYGRAGNGKAIVSTNDWIQVFGEENGWIFIQYDISSDHMRTGWISSDALSNKTSVDELTFSSIASITKREANLTDDPLNSQSSIATLAQGTKVTWLANMGEWAYVEAADIHPIRGFVKIELLEHDGEMR